jgi:CelD/BcsL family acetyltransferase involved in cellulose biosynthesis
MLTAPVDIELVTDVDQLQPYVSGWEVLADRVSQPRSTGAMVAGWARHMMDADSALRIWIALDGSEVVGVLPFVAEKMPRKRLRLVPPATDMMYGIVPVAHPDRAGEVVEAVADDFAARSQQVDLATIYWLPEDSPWLVALRRRFAEPDWVATGMTQYSSYYTSIVEGIDTWLGQRGGEFRRTVRRRARRCAEEGFRVCTLGDPVEIMERLPRLQPLYLRRKRERGGEGYRFDRDMIEAIGTTLEGAKPNRLRLSVVERDKLLIGASLAVRAGSRMSCWLTGFDPEWSRLGPGIAALLEALDAGGRAGCTIADLGVGDQAYKDEFHDASFPLVSVTWCRPRLARLLQLEPPAAVREGDT